MGIFRRKPKQPMPVGQAMCLIDADGWAYVNQQHHQGMDPDAIALLAPITFVVDEAIRLMARGSSEAQSWLREAAELARRGDVDANSAMNPSGVKPLAAGVAPPVATAAWGQFFITPENLLYGDWQRTSDYASDRHRGRFFAALQTAAHWCDVDSGLAEALDGLAQADVDFANPTVRTDLPQMIVDASVEQGVLNRMRDAGPYGDIVGGP